MNTVNITAEIYKDMFLSAIAMMSEHIEELNDLNVFPVPDGDTGSNMFLTLSGVREEEINDCKSLCEVAKEIAHGMLMGARGNSGVILSQFFAGIADGLEGLESASIEELASSFESGVKRAYAAVLTPVEGTILTVMREATEKAKNSKCKNAEEFFDAFMVEAEKTLKKTPEMLKTLKKAGVVDSGGAGLLYIAKGMSSYLETGEKYIPSGENALPSTSQPQSIDIDAFTEYSKLEFGYCTEVMLRLQVAKVENIEYFNEDVIKNYLKTIGNSIVCFKTGSVVKIHIHTFEPYKVLEFCQRYGEFLTVKIENMNLQHNEVVEKESFALHTEQTRERVKYAVVSVAFGKGIINQFREFGSDFVIEGGQTMNPSTDDFIKAFDKVNADHIFVLPCNSNVVLAAEQAAKLYEKSDVRVIKAKTLGDGYSILAMLDYTSDDADSIEEAMNDAMEGIVTGQVSLAIRDASGVKKGDYVAIFDSDIVSSNPSKTETALEMSRKMNLSSHDLLIIIYGKDTSAEEEAQLEAKIKNENPSLEIYSFFGEQDIYDYIIVAE